MIQHQRDKIIIFLIISLFWSCYSLLKTSKDRTLIDLVIQDYYTTQKKDINEYNYFNINKHIINGKCLFCYRVSPILNKFYTPTTKYDLFMVYPTSYIIYKEKTFFWRNTETETPSKDIINYLNSIGFIDSSYIKYELGQIDRDSIQEHIVIKDGRMETVNYIICKDKPNKIKRKIKVPAYYSYEKLIENINCKCN